MVRSIGLDVEQNGLGFIWLPGSLPFLVRDPSKCDLNCAEGNKFYASRVTQNVPFFRNNFIVIPAAEPVDVPEVLSVEQAVEPGARPPKILAPPPFDHKLTHFPNLSACDVCNRARLYSKRVKSRRVVNEDLDLAETEDSGQQLACVNLIGGVTPGGRVHRSGTTNVVTPLECCQSIWQHSPSRWRERISNPHRI